MKLVLPEGFLDEEIRDGYTVSSDIKKVWAIQLDLLAETIRICREYNINYFLSGGSLLGAVRHGGYIPWDDDLDIMMFREDYNRFCEIAPKAFKSPYFFQTEKTDPGYLLRHAKIRNGETTCLFKILEKYDCKFNQGIFLDVFPLDNIPDDMNERNVYYKKLYKAWGKVWELSAYVNRGVRFSFFKNIAMTIKSMFHMEKLYYKKYIALESKYNNYDTKECCVFLCTIQPSGISDKFTWSRQDFNQFVEVPFEMLSVRIPKNYDQILSRQYNNWHKRVMGGAEHGALYFDPEKPYTEYLK